MKIRRRDFLAWLMASGYALRSRPVFAEEPPGEARFSALQGMTDETSTQFSLILPRNDRWVYEFSEVGSRILLPFQSSVHTRDPSAYAVHKISLRGLQLGKRYRLKIRNIADTIHDEREFSTLDLSRRSVRLAFVSCAMDHLHRADIWQRLAEREPELIFFLGDNIYADRRSLWDKVDEADPDMLWSRYMETRLRVSFYFQKKLTPVLAIWDDHDFGGNDIGAEFPYVKESQEYFNVFFAQDRARSLTKGPGIARRLTAFGADFFLLDGRSFRQVGRSLLGDEQRAWLESQLQPRATVLLNGSMFFGAYASDAESYEGQHREEFASLREALKIRGSLAAFVSGDVHYSEIMRIEADQVGHETFELVSSSIHSLTFPGHHDRYHNERRLAADSNHNFLIWEGEFGEDRVQGEVTCVSSTFEPFRTEVWARRF